MQKIYQIYKNSILKEYLDILENIFEKNARRVMSMKFVEIVQNIVMINRDQDMSMLR